MKGTYFIRVDAMTANTISTTTFVLTLCLNCLNATEA